MMNEHDEFYIGYEAAMPPRARSAVTTAVVLAVAVAVVAALIFVSQQHRLAEARFEFGQVRTFEGYLVRTPAPVLLVVDGNGTRSLWLVSQGKFGPSAALGDTPPGWVTLSGSLIEREQWRMIEIASGSIRPVASSAPPPLRGISRARRVSLRGEIVDSKCFLGVMSPGERTVHRDCAVRCLAGGVPPMFAFHDDAGSHLALLLDAAAAIRTHGAGRTITLEGILSGPEESLVLVVGGPR
jgi:hypothetical protein